MLQFGNNKYLRRNGAEADDLLSLDRKKVKDIQRMKLKIDKALIIYFVVCWKESKNIAKEHISFEMAVWADDKK